MVKIVIDNAKLSNISGIFYYMIYRSYALVIPGKCSDID